MMISPGASRGAGARQGEAMNKGAARKRRSHKEALIETTLALSAGLFIIVIAVITIFIFSKGLPIFLQVGWQDFIFNTDWRPGRGIYGIGAMALGSIAVTLSAMVWSVPLGIATAVFMTGIAPRPIGRTLGSLVELLAGIPSVVYGFVGLLVVVPFIRQHLGGNGLSVLAGAIVLGVMILPTLINISRDAIQAVPGEYIEGSLALGASHHQTMARVIIPAARSGIITAIVLGMGRAIGETMAVAMVTGNAAIVPTSILAPVRTMTSNIVLEMGYASGEHQGALFSTGMVLFVFIVALNLVVNRVAKAGGGNGKQ